MGRVLPFVALGLLMIYCVVEVVQANSARVRLMPKWLWAATIIILPGVGALAWLLFGRPAKPSNGGGSARRRPLAPDDDPDFLRGLK